MMACLKFTLNGKETDVIGKCYGHKGFKAVSKCLKIEQNQYFTVILLLSGSKKEFLDYLSFLTATNFSSFASRIKI